MPLTFSDTLLYTGSICLFSMSLIELNKAIDNYKFSNNRPLIAFNSGIFFFSTLFLIKTSKEILRLSNMDQNTT